MRTVGSWALEQPIGSGSFAVVWRARHTGTGQLAAVKEINTARLNGKLQSSLSSEVSVLQRTKHANLVGLLDIIKEQDRLFLVLEYCGGGDLGHFLRRFGPVPEPIAHHLLCQLAAGLKAMRALSLMHRDLKPQNLLLMDNSRSPVLKIADFGFARNLQPQGLAETLCGSPLYMAPEILQLHKYDAKADLWSVGVILFELLAGKPPYNGVNHLQLLQNIERGEGGRMPHHVAAALSPTCVQLVQQLLRRNPLERISYEEFFSHPFLTHPPATSPPPPEPTCTITPAAAAPLPAPPGDDERDAASAPPVPVASDFLAASTGPGRVHSVTTSPAGVPPRVAVTGPLLGVHEATGIAVHSAVMQPAATGPAGALLPDSQGTPAASGPSHAPPARGVAESLYTDIDLGGGGLGASTAALASPGGRGLPGGRQETPGGLSVIEEADDYVVVSTEPSPRSSQHGGTAGPWDTSSPHGFSSGGRLTGSQASQQGGASAAAPSLSASAGAASRGRGAWGALSRVGPALLPPRLVASAALQLRSAAAASSQVNTWVAPLGQLAAHVSSVAHGAGWGTDSSGGAASTQLQKRSSGGVSPAAVTACVSSASGSVASTTSTPARKPGGPAAGQAALRGGASQAAGTGGSIGPGVAHGQAAAAMPNAPGRGAMRLPAEQLTQLARVPAVAAPHELVQRVLQVLVEGALRAWDAALAKAEGACDAALVRHTQQEQKPTEATPSSQQQGGATEGLAGDGGALLGADAQQGRRAMQEAVLAAAPVLRAAAVELVAVHLLCCRLLEGALTAAPGGPTGPAGHTLPSPPTDASSGAGTARPQHKAFLLAACGRSLLEPLQARSRLVAHLLPPSQLLPGGVSVLHRTALDLCRSGAMDEALGQYGASVQAYAKAADLLLFLLTCEASSWGALRALPPGVADAVHQVFVAVRVRQALCMADLNSSLGSRQS